MTVESSNIKVLVVYHKKDKLIKSDIFVPIHAGRKVAELESKDGKIDKEDLKWLQESMIGDDTGDNISHLNRCFAEMTPIYWAWRNYDKLGNPDYIGLNHYRSLFLLSDYPNYSEQNFEERIGTNKLQEKFSLGYELICGHNTTLRIPLREDFPLLVEYEKAERKVEHLNFAESWIEKNRPDVYTDFCSYLNGNIVGAQKNMFVMKKELFFEYCEFIFPLLFAAWDEFKSTIVNQAKNRCVALLGEYMTAFWLCNLQRRGVKTLQVPVIRPNFDALESNDIKQMVYWALNMKSLKVKELRYLIFSKIGKKKRKKRYKQKLTEVRKIKQNILQML